MISNIRKYQLIVILLMLLSPSFAKAAELTSTVEPSSTVQPSDPGTLCFEQYLETTSNAANIYRDDYDSCESSYSTYNELISANEAQERAQLKAGSEELCRNFESCNGLATEEEFLHCYVEMGPANNALVLAIQANSSRAMISLNSDYAEAEKSYKLCTMDCKDNYEASISRALDELHTCLDKAWTI